MKEFCEISQKEGDMSIVYAFDELIVGTSVPNGIEVGKIKGVGENIPFGVQLAPKELKNKSDNCCQIPQMSPDMSPSIQDDTWVSDQSPEVPRTSCDDITTFSNVIASQTPFSSCLSVVQSHTELSIAYNVFPPYFHYGKSIGDDPGSRAHTHDAAQTQRRAHEHGVWEKYCNNILRYEMSILKAHMISPPYLEGGEQNLIVFIEVSKCVSAIFQLQGTPMSHKYNFLSEKFKIFSVTKHKWISRLPIFRERGMEGLSFNPKFINFGQWVMELWGETFSLEISKCFQKVSNFKNIKGTPEPRQCVYPPYFHDGESSGNVYPQFIRHPGEIGVLHGAHGGKNYFFDNLQKCFVDMTPKADPYAYPPYFRGGKSIGDGPSPPACTHGAARNGHDAPRENVRELSCTNFLGYETSSVNAKILPTSSLECGDQNVLIFVENARSMSEILLVQDRPMSHIDSFVRHLPPKFSGFPHVHLSCLAIVFERGESWLQFEPNFTIFGQWHKKL